MCDVCGYDDCVCNDIELSSTDFDILDENHPDD